MNARFYLELPVTLSYVPEHPSVCFKRATWGKCAFALTDETQPIPLYALVCLVCQEQSLFYIMKRRRRTLKHMTATFLSNLMRTSGTLINKCYLIMNIDILVAIPHISIYSS